MHGNERGWHTLVALVLGLALRARLGAVLALVLVAGAAHGEAADVAGREELAVRRGAHAVAADLAHLPGHMLPGILRTRTNKPKKKTHTKHLQFNPQKSRRRKPSFYSYIPQSPSPEMRATHRSVAAVTAALHGAPIRASTGSQRPDPHRLTSFLGFPSRAPAPNRPRARAPTGEAEAAQPSPVVVAVAVAVAVAVVLTQCSPHLARDGDGGGRGKKDAAPTRRRPGVGGRAHDAMPRGLDRRVRSITTFLAGFSDRRLSDKPRDFAE